MSSPIASRFNSTIGDGSPALCHTKSGSQAEATRLQNLWDDSMKHQTKYVHYSKVAVLMISWEDECDDLKTKNEVDRLADVFENMYKFDVKYAKLNGEQRAQAQLSVHLSKFVLEFEKQGESTLLIIYYAGHGWLHYSQDAKSRQKSLGLAGSLSQKAQKQLRRNGIVWDLAEANIKDVEADVFLIFDCCHAGALCRSMENQRFGALAACAADAKTKIPGKTSFTTALIWALGQLASRSNKPFFESWELRKKIVNYPDFPQDQDPQSFGPNICLAPFSFDNNHQGIHFGQTIEASYIDLRFHCVRLDDKVIASIASMLKEMMLKQEFPTHHINFLGKNSEWRPHQQGLAERYWTLWSAFVKGQGRGHQISQTRPVNDGVDVAAIPLSRFGTFRWDLLRFWNWPWILPMLGGLGLSFIGTASLLQFVRDLSELFLNWF
ncbi:hypothetical protein EV356DRAFT_536373 [Viridothelium virens]|uniref:Peptidase C14 caspase domain-containing protein n=1 Tax=Viridothelium virens TaxID=1048519 RepID=A0A6A6GY93_VIRVR|nr:hypothetical protein EV356DRAFT_536373 [Viridothelium virens]